MCICVGISRSSGCSKALMMKMLVQFTLRSRAHDQKLYADA